MLIAISVVGVLIVACFFTIFQNPLLATTLSLICWVPMVIDAGVNYYFQCKSEYDSKNKQ